MLSTTPALIDYHCHLDLYPDYNVQFRTVVAHSIATLAVTTTPQAWHKNLELAGNSPWVRVGLGLHPQLIGQFPNELALFERYLPETRYVGEVGLDAGPKFYRTYDRQKAVFDAVLRLCADSGRKILSVHAVRSVRDVLDSIERHLAGTSNRVVLHWFSGTLAEVRRATELGCYFSINRAMLMKPDPALINAHPIERLLTETDGPFTQVDGRVAVPADVSRTIAELSSFLKKDLPSTMDLLRKNLSALES